MKATLDFDFIKFYAARAYNYQELVTGSRLGYDKIKGLELAIYYNADDYVFYVVELTTGASLGEGHSNIMSAIKMAYDKIMLNEDSLRNLLKSFPYKIKHQSITLVEL